jgi:hypothetical protein
VASIAAYKVLKGTITTDGAGAGSASIVTTGYRLAKVEAYNVSLANAATVSAKDNNGAGTDRLGLTIGAAVQNKSSGFVRLAATTPLVIAVAGGGATKDVRYEVHLKR